MRSGEGGLFPQIRRLFFAAVLAACAAICCFRAARFPVWASMDGGAAQAGGKGSPWGQEAEVNAGLQPEGDTVQEELLAEADWSEIETFLQENRGAGTAVSFRELVRALIAGDTKGIYGQLRAVFREGFAAEISGTSGFARRILALGVVGAVFAAAAGAFPGGQSAGAGAFLTSLLLSVTLAAAFRDGASAAGDLLRKQSEFMTAVIPAYSITVAWAGCHASAVVWMEFLLFLLRCVDGLYLNLLLPLVRIYLLIVLAGGLVREDFLSHAAKLLHGVIVWGMRSLIGLVLGFQLVQGMVLPFADSVKTAGMQKLLSVVPGVGSGVEAMAKVLLGSGVVIKNAMGAAAVFILAALSLGPLVRLALLMGVCRMAAALLQPVADQHVIRLLSGAADGQGLLFGLAACGVIVFALAVALVCLGTNAAYLA